MTDIWVLATGSRDFWHEPTIEIAFRAIETEVGWGRLYHLGPHRYHLIHGACPLRPVRADGAGQVLGSADMHAARVARRMFWHVERSDRAKSVPGMSGFPADWGAHRPRDSRGTNPAGFIRNLEMIDFLLAQRGAKVCVGFVNDFNVITPGTKHCTDNARKRGIRTWIAPMGMGGDREGAL